MNLWHDIAPARVRPEDFFAVIEIEKGSKNKYEMDKETGALRVERAYLCRKFLLLRELFGADQYFFAFQDDIPPE